jgi:hypothetical protein
MLPALCVLVIFWRGSHFYALGWPGHPSSYLHFPCSRADRCTPLCPAFLLVEMEFCALFTLGWPQTAILLISASWVAGIYRCEPPCSALSIFTSRVLPYLILSTPHIAPSFTLCHHYRSFSGEVLTTWVSPTPSSSLNLPPGRWNPRQLLSCFFL